jgi:hypothetical protein
VISLASGTSVASMTSTASKNLSGLNDFYSVISSKKLTELDVSINLDTKKTEPGLLIWNESSKIHYFIGFWHPFSWRLWRARNIKKNKN